MAKSIIALLVLAASVINAEAVTRNASSCSRSDVVTQLSLSVSGDIVTVPGGTCVWTSTVNVPANVTLQGNGASGSNPTVIQSVSSTLRVLQISSGSRLTGLKFLFDSTTNYGGQGFLHILGKNWRVDNCIFQMGGGYGIIFTGGTSENSAAGIIHNCTFIEARIDVNSCGNSFSESNKEWNEFDNLGSGDAVYVEDCVLERTVPIGNVIDANDAGRYVFRYNTVINGEVQCHGLRYGLASPINSTVARRGTRTWEVYGNTFTTDKPTSWGWHRPIFLRSGTGTIFNNTVTTTGSGEWSINTFTLNSVRYDTSGPDLCNGPPPANANDVNMDGNSDATGWLCRDQPGSGRDTALTTKTIGVYDIDWKTQSNAPIYAWNNTFAVASDTPAHIKENRDFYDSYGTTFNGTVGVGIGTLSSMPVTCTTGVGYWATNQGGNWNTQNATDNDGALYKCTSTNTWTLFYIPYQYPHPLRSGGVVEDTTAPVVTNLTQANIACDAASPLDSMTLSVGTNELADCAYCEDSATGCDAGSGYDTILAAGSAYTTTGGITHSQTLTNLPCSASYTYRSACKDKSPRQNKNTTSTASAFTIGAAAGGDITAPTITGAYPAAGTIFVCTSNPCTVTIGLHAEDATTPITCKYDTTDVAYASMANTFSSTGGTTIPSLDDSYPESNYTAPTYQWAIGSASDSDFVGQSFESNGGTLDNAKFFIAKAGSPTGNITARVYAHSGTFGTSSVGTGSALATSDNLDVSTLSTSFAVITFSFSGANRITLVDGTRYVVGLYYTAGSSSDKVYIGRKQGSATHAGNASYLKTSTWTALPTTDDAIFYVYTATTTGANDFYQDLSIQCGSNRTYYARCSDGTNANSTSTQFTFSVASPTPANVYQFEDCTIAAPMLVVADASASGGYYVTTNSDSSGTATCTVSAPSNGTYRIIARSQATDTGSDSVFLTVGSEAQIIWILNPGPNSSARWNIWNILNVNAIGTGTLAFPQHDPYQVALTSGNNTFVFAGREIGAKLDYFYIEKIEQIPTPPIQGGSQVVGSGHTFVVGSGGSGTKVIIP